MAEILQELPDSTSRTTIMNGYKKMMDGLLQYQADSGLWKQVVDYAGSENWEETSGTAMFTYAMITGVKNGWLDKDTFAPAARKAWLALVGKLQADGQLTQISNWCYFTSQDAYLTQAGRNAANSTAGSLTVTGDGHGQAPMLWSAAALLR
jgi:rhamnogalacturonyl hydrolase YesR